MKNLYKIIHFQGIVKCYNYVLSFYIIFWIIQRLCCTHYIDGESLNFLFCLLRFKLLYFIINLCKVCKFIEQMSELLIGNISHLSFNIILFLLNLKVLMVSFKCTFAFSRIIFFFSSYSIYLCILKKLMNTALLLFYVKLPLLNSILIKWSTWLIIKTNIRRKYTCMFVTYFLTLSNKLEKRSWIRLVSLSVCRLSRTRIIIYLIYVNGVYYAMFNIVNKVYSANISLSYTQKNSLTSRYIGKKICSLFNDVTLLKTNWK